MKKILKIVLAMGLIICATACKNEQQPAIDCCEIAYKEAKLRHWESALIEIKQVETYFQKDITPKNCDPELMKKYGETIALLSEAILIIRGIPDSLHWDWNMVYDFQMESAQKGNPVAQYNIGWYYCQKEKFTEAVKWWHKAAVQEYASALYKLGVMYEASIGGYKALNWYRKAAEHGNANAQFNLGVIYAKGKGVPQDHTEAVKWFRKAAEQGNELAQVNLGLIYEEGKGVPKDYTEAVNWYRKAAEQGNELAQLNLGKMYYNGEGITKDNTEAEKWLSKASWQGNLQARKLLLFIEASQKYSTNPSKDDNKETNYRNYIWE